MRQQTRTLTGSYWPGWPVSKHQRERRQINRKKHNAMQHHLLASPSMWPGFKKKNLITSVCVVGSSTTRPWSKQTAHGGIPALFAIVTAQEMEEHTEREKVPGESCGSL